MLFRGSIIDPLSSSNTLYLIIFRFMSNNIFFSFFILTILIFGCNQQKPLDRNSLLKEYVTKLDPSFRYEIIDTLKGDNWKEYRIKMVSGSWLSPDDFDDDSNEWWHWVSMIVPDEIEQTESMMIIGAGSKDDYNGMKSEDIETNKENLKIALATKSIVTEITNIPFQPIDFSNDGKGIRYEDDLIAYGWRQFLEKGAKVEDTEWLARFPMTRAVVKAMDVVQELTQELENSVDSFFVTGASKRGWVTWTTAIADDRVMGIAPVVIDILNLFPSFQHHWRVYGEWSPAVGDYVNEMIMDWTGSKEYEVIIDITDPYSYREQLTLPKFIVNATSDEFFVTDSWQFYWDDLIGKKHLQYLPNTGHGLYGTYKTPSMVSYYNHLISDIEIPQYNWNISGDTINMSINPSNDYVLKKWEVINETERDFRIYKIGESWASETIEKTDDGNYSIVIEKPENGYKAAFVEVLFNPESKFPLGFSSGTLVTPNTYPFSEFISKNPKGSR